MAHNPTLEEILHRISALETANAPPTTPNYSDPPLIFTHHDGSAVDPESFGKIPDLVKDLPNFTGEPGELNNWLCDVDSLVKLYQTNSSHSVEQQNRFHMVCKTIRRKIRGEANDALVASNVSINWNVIKRTLLTYYGEKRDLETLDYQLMTVQQKNDSLETYFDRVNRLLSLIANQIKTDDRFTHPEASKALIETYNKKAIDAFIRGLDGDVYKFIRNYEPTSLAAAYSYCIAFQNVECRKMLTRPRHQEMGVPPRNLIPIVPPRVAPRIMPRRELFPQKPMQIYRPQPIFQNNNFRPPPHFNNFRPGQAPQQFMNPPPKIPQRNPFRPPPEPMEVDPSIQTRQINYGNRPQQNNPSKRPRLFNTATGRYENPQDEIENDIRADYYPSEDEEYYPEESNTYQRYIKQVENQEHNDPEEDAENIAELNFLE